MTGSFAAVMRNFCSLSPRLELVASLCCGADTLCDVGTDHGYLPIKLLLEGKIRSAVAADIRPEPLSTARRNAAEAGLERSIRFELADGLGFVGAESCDTVVCAGMGADTIMSILADAPWLRDPKYRLILQCQSKRPDLRKYLYRHGYAIRRETLAKDGKFLYPVMEVVYELCPEPKPEEYYVTPALLASGSPLVPEYLDRVTNVVEKIVTGHACAEDPTLPEYMAILEALEQTRDNYGKGI